MARPCRQRPREAAANGLETDDQEATSTGLGQPQRGSVADDSAEAGVAATAAAAGQLASMRRFAAEDSDRTGAGVGAGGGAGAGQEAKLGHGLSPSQWQSRLTTRDQASCRESLLQPNNWHGCLPLSF